MSMDPTKPSEAQSRPNAAPTPDRPVHPTPPPELEPRESVAQMAVPPATPLDLITFPLTGRSLIEAAAGTGKTYSLVRIVLRVVLERGIALPRILITTFTRAATAELRLRIEAMLVDAQRAFADLARGDRRAIDADPVLSAIAGRVSVTEALARLERARLDLDDAAIFTLHGLCQRVLAREGYTTPLGPPRAVGARSPGDLLQAVADHYRRQRGSEDFGFLVQLGKTPEAFVAAYRALIDRPIPLADPAAEVDLESTLAAFKQAWTNEECAVFEDACVANRQTEKTQQLWRNHLETLDRIATKPLDTWRTALAAPSGPVARLLDEKELREGWSKTIPKAARQRLPARLNRTAKTITRAEALPKTLATLEALRTWRKRQLERVLVETVRAARDALERQRDVSGRLVFDDLVVALRDALRASSGTELAERLRASYPVALIDEFQDTDPLQFEILESIYWPRHDRPPRAQRDPSVDATADDVMLALIGDPKQAIYRFRGGDLPTYWRAAQRVDHRFAMTTNYRSHSAVVAGYNALFDTATLTDLQHSPLGAGIECPPVAAGAQPPRCLDDAEWIGAPDAACATSDSRPAAANDQATSSLGLHAVDVSGVDWVILPHDETLPGAQNGKKAEGASKAVYGAQVRTALARWTALEVVRLLTEARWVAPGAAGAEAEAPTTEKRLQPRDIAILVRDRTEANAMLTALSELDVPHVYGSDHTPVFDSDEAAELETTLDGILHLEQPARLHAAAIGKLLGVSPVALARALDAEAHPAANPSTHDDAAPEFDYATWLDSIVALRERWRRDGVLALGLTLLQQHARPPAERFERFTTNILHLLERLAEDPVARASPEATLDALRRARAGRAQTADANALEQRLDSDADRVRVLTLHQSKGLEYPVVLLPFASVAKGAASQRAVFEFVLGRGDDKILRLHACDPDDPRVTAHEKENAAESVRLLYVGATRAIHRLVIPLAPHDGFADSLLGRLWKAAKSFQFDDRWPDMVRDHLETLRQQYNDRVASRPCPAPPSCAWRVSTLAPDARAALGPLWREKALEYRNGPAARHRSKADEATEGPPSLAARTFPSHRSNPAHDVWRIHSFSAWTRRLHERHSASGSAGDTHVPPITATASDDDALIHATPRDRDGHPADHPLADEHFTDTAFAAVLLADDGQTADVPEPAPGDAGVPAAESGAGATQTGDAAARASSDRAGRGATTSTPLPPARLVLRGGAEAGNFLHDLFEGLDFPAAAHDPTALRSAIERLAVRHPVPARLALESVDFVAWLLEILAAPLPSGTCLADLDRAATLRECEFHFALDAQQPDQASRLTGILRDHRARHTPRRTSIANAAAASAPAPADLAWLPAALPGRLEGLLHGYVDLIYVHDDRFHIVDYKSTRLGPHFEDYTAERLQSDVEANAYDLQYLLYSLALHRYLRARLAGYVPEKHLGGVEYLYLRGMSADGRCGVFHRAIDIDAVRALDALFGEPRESDAPESTEALA